MRDIWEKEALGDVVSFASGYAFPAKYQGKTTGRWPFYKVSDMNLAGNKRGMVQALNYVEPEDMNDMKFRVWSPGTVIFPKVGAALLTEKRRFLTVEGAFDNNVMGIIAHEEKLLPAYLFLFMQSVRLGDYAQTGALPSVNQSHISSIDIHLPPLSEQRRIVDLMSAVDDAIESAECSAEKYREARLEMGGAIFAGKMRLGSMPLRRMTFSEFAEVNPRESLRGVESLPFVTMADMDVAGRGVLSFSDGKKPGSGAKFRAGDTLIARITPCLQNGKIGVVPTSVGEGLCQGSTEFIVARPRPNVSVGRYVDHLLRSEQFSKYAVPQMIGTSGRQRLDASAVERWIINVPDLDEQRNAADILDAMDEGERCARGEAIKLTLLRSHLLSALLSGHHSIPESYDELLKLQPELAAV